MFVKISSSGAVSLEDVDNFRAFKLVSEVGPALPEAALADVGRIDGDHVWIDAAWLRRNGRPDDEAWLAGFQKMTDYAKSAGWTDDQGAIRAHIG
jgi:hypothetical protein